MFFFILVLFLLSTLIEAKGEENFSQHSFLEIVPKDSLLYDKNYFYFGVKIILEEGWKTYWKNPGEAGAPLSIDFNDNSEILENEILGLKRKIEKVQKFFLKKIYLSPGWKTQKDDIFSPRPLKRPELVLFWARGSR